MINRLPEWLRRPVPLQGKSLQIEMLLGKSSLKTVCEEARCPNRGECYCSGTATFMVMGDTCSRTCRFCSVKKGDMQSLDYSEKEQLHEAISQLDLKHVVLTSVTRDDLPDGGSRYLSDLCRFLKEKNADLTIEILVPDFLGDYFAIASVIGSGVEVFAHNVEMVSRLYPALRPEANYQRSLNVLKYATEVSTIPVKTGIMVGLGETFEEVCELLRDIAEIGVDVVTIGQYLQPTDSQVKVHRFVTPDEFSKYEEFGKKIGISQVVSGPFVRSSYRAVELLNSEMIVRSRAIAEKTC